MKLARVVTAGLVAASVFIGVPGASGPAIGASAPTSVDCDVRTAGKSEPEQPLESFEAVTPERVADTRLTEGGSGPVEAGCALVVDMTGIGPDGLTAYALSVTAITPAAGYVTAFPCADGLPGTSSLNPRAGVATPNLVVVAPDEQNRVCLFVLAGGELIVDVSGWWTAGQNRFRPIDPVRVDDTREALPIRLPAGDVRAIDVAGVVVPDDSIAVTMNVAAVGAASKGFLVVFPCGTSVPLASNVNYLAGETRSVAAISKLGDVGPATGKLCVSASQDVHVVIDITGYFSDTAGSGPDLVLEPVADTRVVDTRVGDVPGQRFVAETIQRFDLSGVLDRPADAVGVLLNVVAVAADTKAFVTVYPCTDEVPFVASINHDEAATANLVVSALDADGAFCVFARRGVDVVVDLIGVYTGRAGSLLNEMTLRDATGAPVPFDQQFSVDGADYTIPCDTARTLQLRLGLAPGATVRVNGIEVRPSLDASDPDREVRIGDEGLLRIEVERGTRDLTYHIRCLPTDFPRFAVEAADGATPVAPGWYITEVGWNEARSSHYLAIFDQRGVPVWFKRANEVLIDTKLLSTGNLVTSPITGTGFGIDADRGHYVVDLGGSVVAQRLTGIETSPVDHHDYVEIPSASGNRRAVISYPRLEGQDLSALNLPTTTGFGTCPGSVVGNGKVIVGGQILEITGSATPDWEWDMTDHFDPADSTYAQCFRNFASENNGVGEVDPFHINSIGRITDPGCEPNCDYIVSARHMDSVFRVDRATGDVDWIIGPASVGDPGDVLAVVGDNRNGPLRPHDARVSGNIVTMHDNRTDSGQPSRAVAYRIDTSAGTATLVWQIEHPEGRNNRSLGSTRITDDDSVLVGWGQIDPMFTEHAISDGTELARWTRVDSTMTAYRIVKYPLDSFDADELRAAAGGTLTDPVLKAD